MADLITRLLLDTQKFDNSLGKSTKEVQAFQARAEKLSQGFSGVMQSLMKFAGSVGLVVSAGEAFEKMMRSNQTASDLFDNNLNAAKDSVDQFFYSISSGDFGAFNGGLLTAYQNAFNLSTKLDELADKKLSLSFIRSEDLRDIEMWETIAKDVNNSYDDRISAAQNMQGVVTHLNKRIAETKRLQLDILNTQYANRSGLSFNEDDIKYFVTNTNFNGDLTGQANAAYKEYIRLQKESQKLIKDAVYTRKQEDIQASQAASTRLREFKEANEFLIKQGWLTEENDEKRKKTVDTLIEQLDLERESYGLQKRVDETKRSVIPIVQNGSSTNKATDQAVPEGSIAEIKKRLADLQKAYENATYDGSRIGLSKAIAEANTQLSMMKLRTQGTKPLEARKPKGKNVTEDLANGKINVKGVTIPRGTIKSNYDYAESLNNIATVMGSVTNFTAEGASAWIAYGTSIVSSVAAALPALAQVIPALQAVTMAQAAASASVVPVVGWINAIAAIGAVAMAFASIPKFATGGIVGGSSYSGDKVPALLNSGEMVLNTTQQSNLFDLLSVGGRPMNIHVSGELRGKGRDLVAVIGKQENFNKRVR